MSPKSRRAESPSLRAFTPEDAVQVARLWQKCFRHSGALPSGALQRYFTDVFLSHPWFDADLAPLVLDVHGEVVGFIGRMARPMYFRQRRIRCAVATQLMVDPDRRLAFGAIDLVRALQSGPQDLCYSDGANERSLRIWQRCGGQASRLLSFEWTRQLRPMQNLCVRLRTIPRLAPLGRMAHPVSGAVDAVAAAVLPRFFHKPVGHLTREPASAMQILPLLFEVCSSASLHPQYSAQSFSWLLRRTAEARSHGALRSVIVLDSHGVSVGWFIYFVHHGATAHVLQTGARYGNSLAVLSELFRDAWEQGAAAVSGQLDPLLITELSNSHCQFRCADYGVLVHSRNEDLLNAIQRGDAFISRLEGEWWMRLGIDRHYDW